MLKNITRVVAEYLNIENIYDKLLDRYDEDLSDEEIIKLDRLTDKIFPMVEEKFEKAVKAICSEIGTDESTAKKMLLCYPYRMQLMNVLHIF